jgi:uncharacterized protein
MFYQGKGVKADLAKAVEWYQKGMFSQILECINTLSAFISLAAVAKIPEAQLELGVAFQEGKGVKADKIKAFDWIEKGMMLQIIQNINILSALLSPAAEAGLPLAQFNLGCIHQNGKGFKADPAKAVGWILKGMFHKLLKILTYSTFFFRQPPMQDYRRLNSILGLYTVRGKKS